MFSPIERDRSGLLRLRKANVCFQFVKCKLSTKGAFIVNFYLFRWRIIVSGYFLVTATFYVLLLSSDKGDS